MGTPESPTGLEAALRDEEVTASDLRETLQDKLPGATIGREYELEYGTDRVEVHSDAIMAGERVLIVDDLIATGGTVVATIDLLEGIGAEIVGCAFVVDLPDLGGSRRLEADGRRVVSLCSFEGE